MIDYGAEVLSDQIIENLLEPFPPGVLPAARGRLVFEGPLPKGSSSPGFASPGLLRYARR